MLDEGSTRARALSGRCLEIKVPGTLSFCFESSEDIRERELTFTRVTGNDMRIMPFILISVGYPRRLPRKEETFPFGYIL